CTGQTVPFIFGGAGLRLKHINIILALTVALAISITAYHLMIKSPQARQILLACMVVVFTAPIAAFYLVFERHSTTRVIAVLSCIVAANVVLRQMFHGFGPTPVFFLVILSGYVFGPLPGFIVGSTTILASNFFVGGHGPWTLLQMSGLGFIGFFAAYIPQKRFQKITLTLYGGLSGLFFGLYTDIFSWLFFTAQYSIKTYFAVALNGMIFTLSYVIGNIVLIWFLSTPFLKVFTRFKKRLTVTIESFD
ncbi:MAG: hypothetical protein KKD39_08875, partial [Candidatus Altiarchaeota archaeon]|nr:hypothetical protein [Candidatus Altiarchaeota archaeon]